MTETPKLKKVIISGIDISQYVYDFEISREYANYVAGADIRISAKAKEVLELDDQLIGDTVEIYRGVNSPDEVIKFRGEVVNIEFDGIYYYFKCYDKLYEAIRTHVTYSFDKDIDIEHGVVSEIFKTLINEYTENLTCDDTTVQNSGTNFTLNKFICRDIEVFERLSDLAKAINWQFYYNPEDDKVYFEPKGFKTGTELIQVGVNVHKVPKWVYNSEKLFNKIQVRGSEQLVETTQFFNGTGENNQNYQLLKTPVSVKVFVGEQNFDPIGAETKPSDNDANLKNGGKIGSTTGEFYYTYDEDSKIRRVKFGSPGNQPYGVPGEFQNNIEILYTYKLPTPVVARRQASIDKYGLREKIVVKSDIKEVHDAEVYAQSQLDKYGDVFATTSVKVTKENDFEVGRIYRTIDPFNDIDEEFLITKVVLRYPNTEGDELTIGDEIWKTDAWDVEVWDRLKRLEEQQTETTDLLIDIREFETTYIHERRWFETQVKSIAGGGAGIYGHPIFGIYGQSRYGSTTGAAFVIGHSVYGIIGDGVIGDSGSSFPFLLNHPQYGVLGISNLGAGPEPSTWQTLQLFPGGNMFKELVYDDVFYDDENSNNVTWDITNEEITILEPGILYTKLLTLNIIYNYVTIRFGNITGDFIVEMSFDNKNTWQTFTPNIRTLIETTNNGSGTYLRITEISGDNWPTMFGTWGEFGVVKIKNTYTSAGNYDKPAIQIRFEE